MESKKNVIFWLAEWIILALLWLLFLGKLEWSEIWIGMGASALAAGAATSVNGKTSPAFTLKPAGCSQAGGFRVIWFGMRC